MLKILLFSLYVSVAGTCIAHTSKPILISQVVPFVPTSSSAMPAHVEQDVSEPGFPQQFPDDAAAQHAGCKFVYFKPGVSSCLLSRHAEFSRHLVVHIYDKQSDGQWHANQQWRIQSWHGRAAARPLLFLPSRHLLALRFEHDHGTGVLQMAELWFAWNAAAGTYQAVLLEIPDAHNFSPGITDKWRARLKLKPQQKAILSRIELDATASLADGYANAENRESAKFDYRETLVWNPATFSFYDATSEKFILESGLRPSFRKKMAAIRIEFLKQRPLPEDLEDGDRLRKKVPSLGKFLF